MVSFEKYEKVESVKKNKKKKKIRTKLKILQNIKIETISFFSKIALLLEKPLLNYLMEKNI